MKLNVLQWHYENTLGMLDKSDEELADMSLTRERVREQLRKLIAEMQLARKAEG